jgi:hypothetical protein
VVAWPGVGSALRVLIGLAVVAGGPVSPAALREESATPVLRLAACDNQSAPRPRLRPGLRVSVSRGGLVKDPPGGEGPFLHPETFVAAEFGAG